MNMVSGRRKAREFEHVVRAVTENDVIGIDIEALREGRLERETVAVGITRQLLGCVGDRLAHCRPGPARIFVGRKLDDSIGIESELACEFFHRLARDVARDSPHVLGG
jgi:hypothetical protein